MTRTSIYATKKTHEAVKQLKEFFECHSQEEVIQHSLTFLIDRELVKTENQETIKYLCDLRKQVAPKILR